MKKKNSTQNNDFLHSIFKSTHKESYSMGLVCPTCGSVYSPYVLKCGTCPISVSTSGVTTDNITAELFEMNKDYPNPKCTEYSWPSLSTRGPRKPDNI